MAYDAKFVSGKFVAAICVPSGVDIVDVESGVLLQAVRSNEFNGDFSSFHAVWCDANDSTKLLVYASGTVYLYEQIVTNHIPSFQWSKVHETPLSNSSTGKLFCPPSFSYPWITVTAHISASAESMVNVMVRNLTNGRSFSINGKCMKQFSAQSAQCFIQQSPSGYGIAVALPKVLDDGDEPVDTPHDLQDSQELAGEASKPSSNDGKVCGCIQLYSGGANMNPSSSKQQECPMLHSIDLTSDIHRTDGKEEDMCGLVDLRWRRCSTTTESTARTDVPGTMTTLPVRELLYTMDTVGRIRLFAAHYSLGPLNNHTNSLITLNATLIPLLVIEDFVSSSKPINSSSFEQKVSDGNAHMDREMSDGRFYSCWLSHGLLAPSEVAAFSTQEERYRTILPHTSSAASLPATLLPHHPMAWLVVKNVGTQVSYYISIHSSPQPGLMTSDYEYRIVGLALGGQQKNTHDQKSTPATGGHADDHYHSGNRMYSCGSFQSDGLGLPLVVNNLSTAHQSRNLLHYQRGLCVCSEQAPCVVSTCNAEGFVVRQDICGYGFVVMKTVDQHYYINCEGSNTTVPSSTRQPRTSTGQDTCWKYLHPHNSQHNHNNLICHVHEHRSSRTAFGMLTDVDSLYMVVSSGQPAVKGVDNRTSFRPLSVRTGPIYFPTPAGAENHKAFIVRSVFHPVGRSDSLLLSLLIKRECTEDASASNKKSNVVSSKVKRFDYAVGVYVWVADVTEGADVETSVLINAHMNQSTPQRGSESHIIGSESHTVYLMPDVHFGLGLRLGCSSGSNDQKKGVYGVVHGMYCDMVVMYIVYAIMMTMCLS